MQFLKQLTDKYCSNPNLKESIVHACSKIKILEENIIEIIFKSINS